jgi:hypothetical protein
VGPAVGTSGGGGGNLSVSALMASLGGDAGAALGGARKRQGLTLVHFQLDLSRLWHKIHPRHPLVHLLNTP